MNAACGSLRRDLARLNESGPELKGRRASCFPSAAACCTDTDKTAYPLSPKTPPIPSPQCKDSPSCFHICCSLGEWLRRATFVFKKLQFNSFAGRCLIYYIYFIFLFSFHPCAGSRHWGRRWEVRTDVCCKSKVSRKGQRASVSSAEGCLTDLANQHPSSDDSLSSRERNIRKCLRFL